MSFSKWWKDASSLQLNLLGGRRIPTLSPELDPLPEELLTLPEEEEPLPEPPNLTAQMHRIHAETIASMSEENAEFLDRHYASFVILARRGWPPHNAWNYLQRLATDDHGRRYTVSQIRERARDVVLQEEAEVQWLSVEERDLDVPEGWEEVVLEWIHYGYDVDYVQSFAYLLSDLEVFGPGDFSRGVRELWDLERVTLEMVPGLDEIYDAAEGEREADEVLAEEAEDAEMGDWDLEDEEEETIITADGIKDETMMDDFLDAEDDAGHSGEISEDDVREPSPTSGRFEIVETCAGGRRFVPVTDTERDGMVRDGEYEESFNRNGTSYMFPKSTREESPFSDYMSTFSHLPVTPPNLGGLSLTTPPSVLNHVPSPTESMTAEEQKFHELDQYYERAVTNLEKRLAFLDEYPDESDGYDTPSKKVNDDDLQNPDKGLTIRLRGSPASPSKASIRGAPRTSSSPSTPSSKSSSSRRSYGFDLSPRARAFLEGRDMPERDVDASHHAAIADDEPSDDDDTGADSYDDDDDGDMGASMDVDHDTSNRDDIHYRLVRASQAPNDAFITTHRSVFSILAAEGWTPYMAWRFVRFLAWSQGGNTTIAEMINTVSEIKEDRLHHAYTQDEEKLVVGFYPQDAALRDIVRTLYRAGFAPEYLHSYVRKLESDGRNPQEIENELEGYDAGDWIWEWVPSMYEIWVDAGAIEVAAKQTPSALSPVHNSSISYARASPPQAEYVDGDAATPSPRRSPHSSSWGRRQQPYSPSYPPLPGGVYPSPSSPSTRRTSSTFTSGSSYHGGGRRPSAAELFFRGENPDHVGAASPRSPRFPTVGSSPTVSSRTARSSSLANTPSTRRSSVGSSPYAPESPPPRSAPDLPVPTKLAAVRKASSSRSPNGRNLSRSPPYGSNTSLPRRSPTPQSPIASLRRSSSGRRHSLSVGQQSSRSPTPPPRLLGVSGSSRRPTPPVRPQGILRKSPAERVPLVNPSRYTNNHQSPPRRVVHTTSTGIHRPHSPGESGPPPYRVVWQCEPPYDPVSSSPERTLGGRINKRSGGGGGGDGGPFSTSPTAIRKSVSPTAIRKSVSPTAIRKSVSPTAVRRYPSAAAEAIRKSAPHHHHHHPPPPPPPPPHPHPAAAIKKAAAATKVVTKVATKAAAKKAVAKKAATKSAAVKKAPITPRRSGRRTKRPDFLGS